MSTWDPARTAEFFDEYGEREWTRFEDGRTPGPSLTTHVRMLEGYVRPGDRVLDAGSGPGRFTLEMLRLGAHVTALDISPGQLELLRARVPDVDAVVGDITDLSRFPDDGFDVTVCFGGPLSYVVDRAELRRRRARARHETGRTCARQRDGARRCGDPLRPDPRRARPPRRAGEVARGRTHRRSPRRRRLRPPPDAHVSLGGARGAARSARRNRRGRSAAGVLPHLEVEEPEIRALLEELEEKLAYDPGSRSCGEHLIGVLRVA